MIYCNNPIIAIIDSGIGGVSILKQLIDKYGYGNYLYYADNLYMPYGNKTKKWLKCHVENIITSLKNKYNIEKVVLACNTASTCFTEKDSNLKIMKFNKKNAYFATQLTKVNKSNLNIIADKTLAKLIEKHIFHEQKLSKIIDFHVKANKLSKYKEIVLGCTHYELVKHLFERVCPNIKFINNSSYIIDEIEVPHSDDLNVVVITTKKDVSLEDRVFKLIEMG